MAPPSLHSRGGVLAAELLQRGVQVIALWTKESNVRHHVPRCGFAFERSVRSSGGTGGVVGDVRVSWMVKGSRCVAV